jgi:hypothetical protein
MTPASRNRGRAAVLAVAVAGLLAACTAGPSGDPASTTAAAGRTLGGPTASGAPSRTSPAPRPPLPTATARSSLPASPPAQLTPVRSSPGDLGRIEVQHGSPLRKGVSVRLPAGSGYAVTAGCIGAPGALLHYSVVGTEQPNDGFLFGSTMPCNGRFVTDTALANIDGTTPARLEVTLDPGVEAATVVLRPTPTDKHL